MQVPQKYRRKTIFTRREMPKSIFAMKLARKMPDDMDVYFWIENNTEGSFDVNTAGAPIPHSGVSILADSGKMVVVAKGTPQTCEHTDYILQIEPDVFIPVSESLFHMTYEKADD